MTLRAQKVIFAISDFLAQLIAFTLGISVLMAYGEYPSIESLAIWWKSTGQIHTLAQTFFSGLVIVRFYTKGLYSKRLPYWDELRQILITVFYLAALNGLFVLVAKWPFSRSLWLSSWLFALILIPLARTVARNLLQKIGSWTRPTIILGSGETAWSTYKALQSEISLGFDIIKFFKVSKSSEDVLDDFRIQTDGFQVIQLFENELLKNLLQLKDQHPQLQIMIALEQSQGDSASKLLEQLSLYFEDVYLIPPLSGLPLFGMEMQHFFSHEVLLLKSKNNLAFRPSYLLKRTFDILFSILILISAAPLLAWIAWQIRKSGPGILFVPRRIGYNGKDFFCYKFRTMVPDAEKVLNELLSKNPIARREWEEKTKITNDPRITKIGQFLRNTSLDELPQLFNVIKGEMSLVGPRPIGHHEIEKYGPRLSFYNSVRPGMTGLWQVSGRSNTHFIYRVQLDTWYVKNWSLWYDIAILFKTVRVVLKREGAI